MKEELLVFMRNQDILSTSERSVTTATDTKSGDGSTTQFTLDNLAVKNVRSVEVNSTALTNYSDYSIDYNTEATNTTITFTTAPSNVVDNISIQYDYGSDKIHGDIPRVDLGLASYPRVAVQYVSDTTRPFSLGSTAFLTTGLFSITVWAESTNKVDSVIKNIRTAVIDNVKSFYHFKDLDFRATGPMIPSSDRGGGRSKLQQRNIDLEAKFIVERIS